MSDWTLSQKGERQPADPVADYAVYDAVGVRIGHVSGLVRDSGGQTQMLKVTTTEWSDPAEYLIPLGAVTLISDKKFIVQLRDLTKQSIGRLCFRYTGELPEKRLLASLKRHFPAPRPSLFDKLSHESETHLSPREVLSWRRLSDMLQPADSQARS